jgi:hypothetical protein
MNPDGVRHDVDDGLAVVSEQTLALADPQGVDAPPGVAGAEELGEVRRVEGDEVSHLLALGLDDRRLLAPSHAPHPGVSGRDDELARPFTHSHPPGRNPDGLPVSPLPSLR